VSIVAGTTEFCKYEIEFGSTSSILTIALVFFKNWNEVLPFATIKQSVITITSQSS